MTFVCCVGSDAVGTDGLPLKFIKLFSAKLLPVLTHVGLKCYFDVIFSFASEGCARGSLPQSSIKGASQLSDFRPINILPDVLSKFMEKLLFDQPIVHLNSNNLLSIYHSGFWESHSTATAFFRSSIQSSIISPILFPCFINDVICYSTLSLPSLCR
jgi:hypothetical protein